MKRRSVVIAVVLMSVFNSFGTRSAPSAQLGYSQFIDYVQQGQVEQVTIDGRTNTLLVQDISAKISEIRKLVSQLDIPVKQVLIESRIVVVNDDFSRDLGVRAGLTYVTDDGVDARRSATWNGPPPARRRPGRPRSAACR